MKSLITSAFGIYPGEGKNTFRFIRLAIFLSFACSLVETISIGLFTQKIGAIYLPITHIIAASLLVIISCFFIYLLRKTTPHNIFYKILYIKLIFFLIFAIVFLFPISNWFWFVLQISSRIFSVIFIATYWTFLSQYHDMQEAKRMYGIYNAAYFIGYILSGILINFTFKFLGIFILFFIASALVIISLIETYLIKLNVHPIEDDVSEGFLFDGKKGIISFFRLFFKSNYAVILVTVSLIVQIISTTTTFSYMGSFEKILNPNNNICEFLAKCKIYIAIANIILGIFFYGRFIKKIGLANMILIPPIFFVMLFSQWSVDTSLIIAILGVVGVENIIFTIEDNNFNILINAAPLKSQNIIRIINDAFFEPLGMLLCSLFLIIIPISSITLGLILTIVFLTASLILRHLYPKSILKNLRENAVHFGRKFTDWMKLLNKKEQKEILQDLYTALKNGSEETQLLAFEALLSFKSDNFFLSIIHLFEELSINGKIKLLKMLDQSCFASNAKIIEKIDNILKYETSTQLVKWCNFYLAKRGLLHPEKILHYLDSEDPFLRATAIITLNNSKAVTFAETAALNKTIAIRELNLLLNEKEEEICMGLSIITHLKANDFLEKVLGLLSHPSLKVKQKAAKALSKLSNKSISRYAPKIIEEIKNSSDSKFKVLCLEALGNINDSSTLKDIILISVFFRPIEKRKAESVIAKMGLKTVPILISIIKDTTLHNRCRILSGKILGKIALPQLQANLTDIIDKELKKAYFYLFYGSEVQKKYPTYDLKLLEKALLTGYNSSVNFIVHLLGAAGSIDDCDLIVHSLHSKSAKNKAQAIETLEKNCHAKILKHLHPLINNVPWETKINAYKDLLGSYPKISLYKLLKTLEDSSSSFDNAISTHYLSKLQMPNWKESLKNQLKTCDVQLHQYAYELLELAKGDSS